MTLQATRSTVYKYHFLELDASQPNVVLELILFVSRKILFSYSNDRVCVCHLNECRVP